MLPVLNYQGFHFDIIYFAVYCFEMKYVIVQYIDSRTEVDEMNDKCPPLKLYSIYPICNPFKIHIVLYNTILLFEYFRISV